MQQLAGKVAIVTGGGRGIGRGIARQFALAGAKVAILSIDGKDVADATAEIIAAGGQCLGIVCDVTEHALIPRHVRAVVEAFGAIDILVNNAHDTGDIYHTVDGLTPDMVLRQMNSGPIAVLIFMQECAPYMKGRGGRIINLASAAGVVGMKEVAGYAMAKEATRALTRCAAKSWATDDITVNAIAPAAGSEAVESAVAAGDLSLQDMNPMQRLGSVDNDIAPVAIFLASGAAKFITGSTIFVDGGGFMDAGR